MTRKSESPLGAFKSCDIVHVYHHVSKDLLVHFYILLLCGYYSSAAVISPAHQELKYCWLEAKAIIKDFTFTSDPMPNLRSTLPLECFDLKLHTYSTSLGTSNILLGSAFESK